MNNVAHAMLTPWANPVSSCVMPPKLSSKESRDLILSCVARRRNYTAGSSSLFWTEFKCAVNFGDPSPKGRKGLCLIEVISFVLSHTHHVSKVRLIGDFYFYFSHSYSSLTQCRCVGTLLYHMEWKQVKKLGDWSDFLVGNKATFMCHCTHFKVVPAVCWCMNSAVCFSVCGD